MKNLGSRSSSARSSRVVVLTVVVLIGVVSIGRAAVTSNGDVTPDPTTTTLTNYLIVGNTADGSMTVDGGSLVESSISYIGLNSGSTGSVTVGGVGSVWMSSGDLYVGRDGNGTLSITGGGSVSNDYGRIGHGFRAPGSVAVDGNGSTWINRGSLAVGASGFGTLTIGSGGHVLVGNDLSINSVSTLAFTLSNPSDPFLDVNGSASLDGTLLVDVSPSLTLAAGDTFTITDIGGSQSGQFVNYAEGDFVTAKGGVDLRLTYAGGTGNDVELFALLLGDMDGNGILNLGDVGALVLALTNRTAYNAAYPTVNADFAGDADHSNIFDTGDIGPFSGLFGGLASANAVPEPSTFLLAAFALLGLAYGRRRRA